MSEPAVRFSGVQKSYRKSVALHDLTLEVGRGELFGLVGVNGAGKTTTLSLAMGFIRASSGTAEVLGADPWRDAATLHTRIAWLPGDVRLPDGISGREWLTYQLSAAGLDRGRLETLSNQWEVPLEKPMQTLSKGNRQKVALLRLLASDAELLILDEPTSGLDPVAQERLLVALRERARHGATVLFSSHSLAEVQTLCDRIAVIDAGRVLQTGTLTALTGGTQTLRVWTRDALPAQVLEGWHANLVTPTHAILEGARLLQDALPRLEPFGVERAEFGGLGLEELLERAHRHSQGGNVQEVAR
jgi:ABC-2 type transport system ATP-binding protein